MAGKQDKVGQTKKIPAVPKAMDGQGGSNSKVHDKYWQDI
jgi:hypothetical protein